MKTFDRGRH